MDSEPLDVARCPAPGRRSRRRRGGPAGPWTRKRTEGVAPRASSRPPWCSRQNASKATASTVEHPGPVGPPGPARADGGRRGWRRRSWASSSSSSWTSKPARRNPVPPRTDRALVTTKVKPRARSGRGRNSTKAADRGRTAVGLRWATRPSARQLARPRPLPALLDGLRAPGPSPHAAGRCPSRTWPRHAYVPGPLRG